MNGTEATGLVQTIHDRKSQPGLRRPLRQQHIGRLAVKAAQRLIETGRNRAQVALAAMRGLEKNRAIISPGWRNRLLPQLLRLTPRALVRRIAMRMVRPLLPRTPDGEQAQARALD